MIIAVASNAPQRRAMVPSPVNLAKTNFVRIIFLLGLVCVGADATTLRG